MRSRRVFALLSGVALALVACEQLVGLDKFNKCDPCTDASLDTTASDVADGGSNDAFILPDGVSEASSWARWRMDNPLPEVLDGASDASLTHFSAGSGGVHDDVTNLTWSTSVGLANNVDSAASYCTGLGFRLPTRIEIASLLDSTRASAPYITPTFDAPLAYAGSFSNAFIWTSSYKRPVGANLEFWFASLSDGNMTTSTPGQGPVLCVK